MKILNLALLFIAITSTAAHADELSFEDTNEFLTPHDEKVEDILANETWAYKFELVRANGTTTVLSEQNINVMLKPASTMKIFTGYWAYKEKNRTDAYIYQMLRQSVNSMADATSQRMGGVLAMEDYYKDLGLDLNSTNFIAADGSGLSYDNQATCEAEINLLKLIKKDASYSKFKKLMAQPGKDGTLKTRLTGLSGLVFAKTGTLAKTAALSGFVETNKGTVLFCVIGDYLKATSKAVRVKKKNGGYRTVYQDTTLTNARAKIDKMVQNNYSLGNKAK